MDSTSPTLLERLRGPDDQAAWHRFDQLYSPLILRCARGVGLSEPDAADVRQEVLLVLTREMSAFQYDPQRSNFRGWLRTITVNKCRERFRRRATRPEAAGDDDGMSAIEASVTDSLFGDSEYMQYVVGRAMEIMRNEFETTTWRACWEHTVSGRTAAEVGAQLGMSEAAVFVAKSRVLRRLREGLQGLID